MLYKYRGIKELRYFTDIVLNKRLYASPYFDLNDPMEGHYLYNQGELDSDVKNIIKSQKEKLRICSLSNINNNDLMWAHYTNNLGFLLEFNHNNFNKNKFLGPYPMNYVPTLETIDFINPYIP